MSSALTEPISSALFKNNLENVKEKATTSINASVTRANIAIDHAKESATDFSINKMHEIVHRVIHEKVGHHLHLHLTLHRLINVQNVILNLKIEVEEVV